MRGLGAIKVINQREQRKVSRREHKLRNGRVAKLLVKREAGAGLLKTPWFDMKKKLGSLKVTQSEDAEGARKTNAEVAKKMTTALKKLKK